MSDFPADYTERLNLREQIARIDRNQAEVQKLLAEAAKFKRERFFAPILAAGVLAGAVGGLLPTVLRATGVIP